MKLRRWTALVLAATTGCGGHFVYRLPTPVAQARATFLPLGACASAAGLESYEQPDSLNVKFARGVYIQFMIQETAYNMVVVFAALLSDQDREAMAKQAKQKGDELYACAMRGGPGEATGAAAPAEAVGAEAVGAEAPGGPEDGAPAGSGG